MNRKRLLAVIVIFFLVQMVFSGGVLQAQDAVLNPPTRIAANYFREMYAVLSTAISVYKLDAIEGDTRESIINKYGAALAGLDIKFDFERINMLKKGWTRYYPVAIHGEIFILRLFLTKERVYQPVLPVLFEMAINNPTVTCQILPDINSILDKHSMKPQLLSPQREVATSL